MKIHLLFFATLKDRAGQARAELDLPEDVTVNDLRAQVAWLFPETAPLLNHALVAVNQAYAFGEDRIPEDAEVAFFPPVSGGSEGGTSFPTILRVNNDPLDLDELVEKITLPTSGAAAVFTGIVRGVTRREIPHETVCLEYEAYVPMAEAKMAQVASEIRESLSCSGLAAWKPEHLLCSSPARRLTAIRACSRRLATVSTG
jgi:molybdopterin synthase catalytic subunit